MNARLVRVLGGADTERLRARLRERMARGLPLTGVITLSDPTEAERAAIERLLGRRPGSGRSVRVPLGRLDEVLRDAGIWADGLPAAIEALTGPVTVRADAAAATAAAWERAVAPLETVVRRRPELAEWFAGLVGAGTLRRIARTPEDAEPLVAQLCAVLDRFPAPPQPMSRFAATVLGNAHALDDARPLTGLVLGAARAIGGVAEGSGAAWRRSVWASVGLVRDELTSTVLSLGLAAERSAGTGAAVAELRAVGQPAVLTLRQLLTDPPHWRCAEVFVCENPAVAAAAADLLGARSRALVCTAGQPGVAVTVLLDQLVRAGARLRYHGDFDWYGIRIANLLYRRYRWQPWRFGADEYRIAVARHSGTRLRGEPCAADWDAQLGAAMRDVGVQVEEEAVLDQLLTDLAGSS